MRKEPTDKGTLLVLVVVIVFKACFTRLARHALLKIKICPDPQIILNEVKKEESIQGLGMNFIPKSQDLPAILFLSGS